VGAEMGGGIAVVIVVVVVVVVVTLQLGEPWVVCISVVAPNPPPLVSYCSMRLAALLGESVNTSC